LPKIRQANGAAGRLDITRLLEVSACVRFFARDRGEAQRPPLLPRDRCPQSRNVRNISQLFTAMSPQMIRSISNALVAVTLATASLAGAQSFPTKPIRLICPFPPAGAVDIASRAIAAELSKNLGQTVTVDNRPGAGGNIGGVEAARSAPDGYTLFMTTSGINAINPALYAKMPFDPIKDLVPVVALVSLSNVLVVNPSVKANSVADVIALARAEPGKLTYASSGNGTSIHMSGEMFKYLAKVDMLHIPYKGSAPAMTDLLGGQVMMMFDNIPSALPHIRAGKLRALAVTGAKRDPLLPDVPTVAEAGVPGYESGVWFGLAVPAGTPKEVIARINEAAVLGTKSPEFIKRMTEMGYSIIGGTPEQMAEMNKVETARWAPIVKASGAKVD
jgi:tripartite-type tricarboxylate transporter receptor subunit TctC